ncbi:MAG: plastocyanin [Methanomicrobiales archaeon]|nr:plastocyanin [Methanomicrobiales archaeon]
MRPHTLRMAFLVIAVCLCLIGGAAAQQGGADNITASPEATTPAGGANVTDLTNAGAPQAVEFTDNKTVTTFGNVSGFTPEVSLELVVDNFTTAPMMVTTAPGDDSGRLYVVDQIGVVKILDANGSVAEEPFLDLRDNLADLDPTYDERGLLSITFHPEFQQNGKVYAFYSAPLREGAPTGWSCTNHISEFTVEEDNPDRVNVSSEKILMYIDKSYENHNGGVLAFGPDDGYLYISVGDIGRANDVGDAHNPLIGNAQDLTMIYGKVLRIDVAGGNQTPMESPPVVDETNLTEDFRGYSQPTNITWTTTEGRFYSVPEDNPFVTTGPSILDTYAYKEIPPEIYAYGFRNPAFMSFDAGGKHALLISMAGQDLFESVLDVVKGGNYGWNIREGTHCFDANNSLQPPASCNATGYQGEPLIGPVVEYGHDVGNVIVGGEIYRGTDLSNFTGRYVFGSWSSPGNYVTPEGILFVATPPDGWSERGPVPAEELTPEDSAMWTLQELRVLGDPGQEDGRLNQFVRSISRDSDNEIYLLTNTVGGPNSSTVTGSLWKFTPSQGAEAGNVTTAGNTTTTKVAAGAGDTPSSTSSVTPDHGQISQIWDLLQPPAQNWTIWELLKQTETAIPFEETPVYGNFTILIELLQATGVDQILEGQGPYTVFAPTDGAFTKDLSPDELSALTGNHDGTINRTAIALNHIVSGSYTESALQNETTLVTLAGNTITVNATEGGIRIGNATIIIPDLVVKNGVVQGVDHVLLPAGAGGTADLS